MSEQPDGPVVVIGPDGPVVMGAPHGIVEEGQVPREPGAVERMVSAPDKVMRIGSMVKQLLDEVKAAPLDDRSRARLAEIHTRSIAELSDGLAPELAEELHRLALPFSADEIPTDAELRIAQAQLVGWLEGLFHGMQAALVAQQVNARLLEQVRGKALPGGQQGPAGPGQYL